MPSLKGIGASIKRLFGFNKSKAERSHTQTANTIAKDKQKKVHHHSFDELRRFYKVRRELQRLADKRRAYRKCKKMLGDKTRKMNFAKAKMAAVLFFLLSASVFSFGQDCNSPNNLPVIAGGVTFTQGYMSPNIKFGFWRNVKPSGITFFVGYQDMMPVASTPNAKHTADSMHFADVYFAEFGYKLRLNEKLHLHAYGGANPIKLYFGADLFYELGNTAMMGLTYRMEAVGFSLIFRLK